MNWREVVAQALAEDLGPGDVTTEATVPACLQARGVFLAKQAGVLAGIEVAAECFRQVDPACVFTALKADGEAFVVGDHVATVTGPARALLGAERTALNFVQRLSGVATLTRAFVDKVAGTHARIVDTRKTTPGLRELQKAAVRAGGGGNHRFALYDGILLKDNHLAVAGGVTAAVAAARARASHMLKVEVEVTNLDELAEAIAAGADIAMLDNMSLEQMREAVAFTAGRVLLEASGGVTLQTVADIAATGVDLISVGALTHSAPAVDLSLEIEPI
jgi:nicotinate-nucleotide pyrophosphorylase (carboxylating)